jgi:Transglutaminase-like superfamily/Domain of unknown function (DUF4129)
MRNAAMERLSKIISESPVSYDKDRNKRSFTLADAGLSLHLAEGWLALFLFALMVYSVIWCIQSAGWVDNLNILTLIALAGLLFGLWSSKQRLLSAPFVYSVAVLIGIALSFWQMILVFYAGNMMKSMQGVLHWPTLLIIGHTNQDPSMYFVFLLLTGYLLAYISALLLYRWRRPWLLVIVNATVLLFNLNGMQPSSIIFLVLFLISALLLLLRFNLYESMQLWERQGLRYADGVTWDIMKAGIWITLGVLIFAWLLPAQYQEPQLAQLWNSTGLLGQVSNALSSGNGPNIPSPGSFGDTLVLGGNPNLTNQVVFKVKNNDGQPQYLTFVTYNAYDRGWEITGTNQRYNVAANTALATDSRETHSVIQNIEVVTPPREEQPYLIGASDVTEMSLSSVILDGDGGIVAWLGTTGLKAGTKYTVTSSTSSVDTTSLRGIPMPADAPAYTPSPNADVQAPIEYYVPAVVSDFTQIPTYLKDDRRISILAKQIVARAGAKTMYDKVSAIETYLRTQYTYNTNIQPPAGIDPVLWFLFNNPQRDGYCNYFSTAMTLLVRSLGIPAREAAGYAPGTYDSGQYIIHGMDAHSWTQVYFAGYGWINFEPSASFKQFVRPLVNQYSSSGSSSSGSSQNPTTLPQTNPKHLRSLDNSDSGGSGITPQQSALQLRTQLDSLLVALLILMVLGGSIFVFWWRRLFNHYSLATQLYGRVCTLADWAGIRRQPSQTPYEYLHNLSISALPVARDTTALERLGDIYVRERWADPTSEDHPQRSGEIKELPLLWKSVRLHLVRYVLRHPIFLRRILKLPGKAIERLRKKRS